MTSPSMAERKRAVEHSIYLDSEMTLYHSKNQDSEMTLYHSKNLDSEMTLYHSKKVGVAVETIVCFLLFLLCKAKNLVYF